VKILKDFKWLLFDLGGVLVEYAGTERLKTWMHNGAQDWELHRLWLFSPAVRAFESGRISPVIFAEMIIAELGLNVNPDVFLQEFPDFVTGYFPGAEELLYALSARRPLAMLSNTNSPQWEKLCGMSHADRLFRKLFLSFKTGLMKPDREAYINVVEQLGCEPEDIAFFDDNPDNVRGALDAGIHAVHVKGFEDMRQIIYQMGLLPGNS
jgi:putative hydrolase of the HAD superfamily